MTDAIIPINPAPIKRRFAAEDTYRLRIASDPRVSPDGEWVAFTLRVVDRAENRYRTNIWAATIAEGRNHVKRLTSGPKSDSHPRWSSDGRLAFLSDRGQEGERDEQAGGGKPQIWLLDMNGGEAMQLTFVREGVGSFEWSPDGTRIAFIAEVEDPELVAYEERIRKMGIRATRAPGQPEAELPTPEEEAKGADATFAAEDTAGQERTVAKPPTGSEEADTSEYDKSVENKPLVVSRLHYKFDGAGFFDTKRSHIFVIDVPAAATDVETVLSQLELATQKQGDKKDDDKKDDKLNPKLKKAQERDPRDTSRQITTGSYDHADLCWSPDGTKLAFSSNRLPDRDYHYALSDIFLLEIPSPLKVESGQDSPPREAGAGGGFATPRQLTRTQGAASAPVFSPDGSALICVSNLTEDNVGWRNFRICRLDPTQEQQEPVVLTADFPRSVGAEGVMAVGERPQFSRDGRCIYFFAGDRGNSSIFCVPLNPGDNDPQATSGPEKDSRVVRLVSGDNFRMTGFDLSKDAEFVYCLTQTFIPSDLYACALDGTSRRRLTDLNSKLMAELSLGSEERFSIENEGLTIEGWLHKPANFDPQKKYPLILQIHGGPQSSFGDGWNVFNQALAGRDYVVVYANCRGSTSYGEEFAFGCVKDWGGGDYRDLMAAVDYACTLPYVDTARLGVTGYSYGGYMTNWIVTQTTRFKAAVTQASLSNMMSDWGTCDTGMLFDDVQFGAPPFDEVALYLERSPVMHARKVETPLLILHGELDYRCMMEQAEQMYSALKYLRKDVEFVRFPNEPHALFRRGQPRHQIEWLGLMVGWFAEKL